MNFPVRFRFSEGLKQVPSAANGASGLSRVLHRDAAQAPRRRTVRQEAVLRRPVQAVWPDCEVIRIPNAEHILCVVVDGQGMVDRVETGKERRC